MQAVAKRMVEYDPDDSGWWVLWAQATSKAESVEAGRLILLNALERHAHDLGVRTRLGKGQLEGNHQRHAGDRQREARIQESGCREALH